LPKKSSTYLIAGNKLMSETTMTNVVDDLTGKKYLVRNTASTTYNYFEGDATKSSFSTTNNTNYDAHGNVLVSSTNVNNIETTTTTTTYGAYPGSIPNKPTAVSISKTRSGQSAKSNSTSFAYNSMGQLTSKVDFVGLPNTITTTYGYNNLGNNNSTTITPNGMTPRSTSSVFDTKGRAAESSTNVLGQTTSTAYNWLWGKPSRTTSLNNINTDYAYDAFGRASSTNYKVGLGDAYTISQDYTWDISGNQIYRTRISHPGKPDVTTWSDILGREIKTETDGFGGSIYTNQTYDAKGNVATSTKPYKTGESQLITTNTYDVYNRMQSITSNVGVFGSSSVAYSFANGNLTTTTTTPDGQTSSKTTDAAGKVISANDPGGTLTYTYNSQGNLLKVNNGAVDVTVSDYDDYSRQTYLTDKNAGTTSYIYNALGQLISETNAKGNVTTMVYDVSGRVLTRTGVEGTTSNTYNTSGSGINQLASVTSFAGNTESYSYNGYGQLQSTTEVIDGKTLTTSYLYNKYDDVTQKTYPSGLKIGYNYDGNGYISQINNVTSGSYTIYANNGMNGFGQNTNYATGNGKSSTNTYYYGVPTRFQTAGVQDLEMTWQYNTGNLTQRKDYTKNKWETFTYDTQNRLTSATVNGASAVTIAYENLGNITSKTDAGTYSYDGNKINAVASVSNPNSTIPLLQQNINYNSFQQPTSIAENGNNLAYTYGSDYNRIKSVLNKGGVITTRYYFGDYEETTTSGVEKKLAYIGSPAGLIAIVEGTNIVHYTYTDHLGSIVAAQKDDGTFYEQNFDAWGRRRDPANWSPYAPTAVVPSLPDWLYRGYTGHEMLDAFGLINMNARLYDPVVGRVLSPDNYVQAPYSTQNYNRYSYAYNNPLRYNDPDGNFSRMAFTGLAFGAEFLSNIIQGVSNPGKTAWNKATSVANEISNITNFSLSNNLSLNINMFSLGIGINYSNSSGASFGVGIGLMSGPYANGGITISSGDYSLGLGVGVGTNTFSYGGTINHKGWSVGYYQTRYGNSIDNPEGVANKQTVGGVSVVTPAGWSWRYENDFLSGSGKDQWRSHGFEIGYKDFILNSTIYNNNPNPAHGGHSDWDLNLTSISGKRNKHNNGGWVDGQTYFARLGIGYNFGGHVERFGISNPWVQEFSQNNTHREGFPGVNLGINKFGYQHYYPRYDCFDHSNWFYSGYYNKYSLWGK
jgi:RHS repeat-associated protein